MNLFDRVEFHAGLTPGHVARKSRELYPTYHDNGMGYWEKDGQKSLHHLFRLQTLDLM